MLDNDKTQIEELYHSLLNAWNMMDALKYASFFTTDATVIGFDGTLHDGKKNIETQIGNIFKDHQTAKYISKIRNIRFLNNNIAVLRAIVGMIPPCKLDLNPDANAIQSMITIKNDDKWKITYFQNTPAQFHGRPDLSEKMTSELQDHISNS